MRLSQLPKINKLRAQYDNSVRYLRIATPAWLDLTTGMIHVEPEYAVIGWCPHPPENLMFNREGQVLLFLYHPEYGEIWEHYPADDPEEEIFLPHTKFD